MCITPSHMNRSVCSKIKFANDDFIHENSLSLATKEPDRLLKGHIFQELLPMWQLNLSYTYSHRKFYLTHLASRV